MKKTILLLLPLFALKVIAQQPVQSFNDAFKKFTADANLKHATVGLLVINTTNGKIVTDAHSETGLAPASTQKVITAATAYSLLGKDFTYKTTLGYTGEVINGVLNGDIVIKGSGDPTLGSWRYSSTNEKKIIEQLKAVISQQGIHEITGHVIADENIWTDEATPDGWVWQDIGSYYGAGARGLNWRENQYDLWLRSGGSLGDSVKISGTEPSFIDGLHLRSRATSAAKGTGDRAYIYHPLNNKFGFVRGTIPINENKFTISGAMPHPARQLAITLEAALKNTSPESIAAAYPEEISIPSPVKNFYTHTSPTLDSISYWFLKKSINLYGEALLKTIGQNSDAPGSTESGLNALHAFWKKQGLQPYAINMADGSGLSPGNRVTPRSLVKVLQYAKTQSWFGSYYDGFPIIHGIRMKSGSINGVLSYTGFVKNKKGEEYVFAFIVNNYNAGGNAMRQKMWALLDLLK